MIGDVERHALGLPRDAGIARRAVEPIGERACRHFPGQRVLAPAGAQQQDIHGSERISLLGIGKTAGCRGLDPRPRRTTLIGSTAGSKPKAHGQCPAIHISPWPGIRESAMNRPAAGVALLLAFCVGGQSHAHGETIAVFTKNQGPIFAALRAGAAVAAKNLGVQLVNYVPSTPDSVAEQNKLVDDAIKDKPDAIVFVPVKFTEADGAVKKINAAQIPLINVNEPLVNASIVGYVGTNDVSLARETGRYLLKAMNGNGNVVILDGPDKSFTAEGRGRGYRDVIKEFPGVKLLDGT